MSYLRFPVVMLLVVLSTSSAYAIGEITSEQLREFALARVEDGQRLVLGRAAVPPPTVDPNAGCIELYQRRVGLWQQTHDRKPAYWEDPRNQAAVFIGTMWAPAFYFLSFSAISAHLDDLKDIGPQAELDALSRVSAELRCFEK